MRAFTPRLARRRASSRAIHGTVERFNVLARPMRAIAYLAFWPYGSVVAKRRNGPYGVEAIGDWIKVKNPDAPPRAEGDQAAVRSCYNGCVSRP